MVESVAYVALALAVTLGSPTISRLLIYFLYSPKLIILFGSGDEKRKAIETSEIFTPSGETGLTINNRDK